MAEAKTGAVIVQSGRRIDAPDAKTPRFPLHNIDRVRRQVADILRKERPEAVVSAAACGADLILLDVAGSMNIERVIILPSAPDAFRQSSVVDRPGDWGELFDRMMREIRVEVVSVPEGDAGYLETNLKLLNRAEVLAKQKKRTVKAMVIWDGKSRGADDVTNHFREQAKLRQMPILEVATV